MLLALSAVLAGCGTARAVHEARQSQRSWIDRGTGKEAEEPVAPVSLRGWSLPSLVDFALTNRPSMARARLAVEDARLALRATAANAPIVSSTPWNALGASASIGHSESSQPANELKGDTDGSASGSLSLEVLVYDFGRNAAEARAKAEEVLSAELSLDGSGYSIFEEVTTGYFTLLRNTALLDVARAQVDEYAGHVEQAELRMEQGEAKAVDVLKAKLDLARAEQEVVAASNDVETAGADLMAALGVDAAMGDFRSVLGPFGDGLSRSRRCFAATTASAEELYDFACTNAPSMKVARARLRAASARVDEAVADLYPSISANVSLNWTDPLWLWRWGVSGTQTLLTGGRRRVAVERAKGGARRRLGRTRPLVRPRAGRRRARQRGGGARDGAGERPARTREPRDGARAVQGRRREPRRLRRRGGGLRRRARRPGARVLPRTDRRGAAVQADGRPARIRRRTAGGGEMRRLMGFGVVGLLGVALVAGCDRKVPIVAGRKGPVYRTAPVSRTDIVRSVSATGSVTPRNSSKGIPVGAQVNGKLIKLYVDYNDVVTNGQVVALIDPQVYDANYKSAVAQLHVNEANVEVREAAVRSAEAELVLAQKTYDRKKALAEKNMAPVADFDSATESLDRAKASLESAKANLKSARASVEQSQAAASKSKADLDYCTIVSPVDGIVIDRKVEEGETVVSSMNAVPVLSIAEDLDTVWVAADIPEADIGGIRVGQDVTFTVDAYRTRFKGKVKQIRKASTTTNNVVTFPVIVEAENPDQMLFPGMTATLSIETARAENVVSVAAAALRFRPKDEDLDRIEGEIPRGRKLWLVPAKEGDPPEYVLVEEGVTDDSFIEITGANAASLEGREAIVGYQTPNMPDAGGKDATNPFMPKFPRRNQNKGTAPEPREKK